jgi:acyl transferase domain-containing protein
MNIAIVGAGCRFPGGVRDLPSLWNLLLHGGNVIDDVPADRWSGEFHSTDPQRAGTTYCPVGGFLEDIDRFDAEFFRISPREARDMDPQQRLLLEVSWEAVEDAGLTRTALDGSETGVYMGILGMDYTVLHSKTLGVDGIGPYFATGKEFSFGSGRISYVLGLHGPSMTINTACSSSLVATHLACQSLLTGESDIALAGGVNAVASPELSIFLSKAQAMSPTGSCKPFDAAADGIVRGEGCGVVVLKRLEDAVENGDRVLGVILGGAMNHDGQSAGLTVPSMSAQEALIRRAMRTAGVGPEDIAYVEAHGTGTPLGDPIEMGALGATLGSGRKDPLVVGSLKANFGHMDSAAGVAGLLKALLVVRNRIAPPQLHLNEPNPRIAWDRLGLTAPRTATPVGADDRPAVAGVSAFGLSGTNAHLILRDAPETAPENAPEGAAEDPRTRILVMSASSKDTLRARAAAFHDLLGHDAHDDAPALGDLVYTASVRRTHHAWRLAVCGDSREALAEALAAHLDGEKHPAVHRGGIEDQSPPPVVFAFSGQGSQWPGMGADLRETEPVVRETLDECDALFREHADGWSLLDELRGTGDSRLTETEIAQPAIFAVQLALARLWRARGVEPTAVVGHSMGEVAAACFAGALALPDAARLIVHRGRLMQAASGSGRMAAVECSPDEAREVVDSYADVCVATVNGPRAIVIAGDAGQITDAVKDLKEAGHTCTPLPVDYAFHSPAVHRYGDELETLLDGLATAEPSVPLLSSVDPETENPVLDPAYWGRNVREPVRFWPAADRLLAERDAAFVEIGPHPVLSRPLAAALVHRDRDAPVVSSLRRGRSGEETMAAATAKLHVGGVPIAWDRLYDGRPTALPVHAWAGSRYWLPGVDRGRQGGRLDVSRLRAEVRLMDENGRLVAELSGDAADDVPAVHGSPANGSQPSGANGQSANGQSANGQSANGHRRIGQDGHATPEPETAATARPNGASAGSARERLCTLIQTTLADLLEWEPGTRVPRTRGFYDLGLDSVATMELAKRLSADLGHEVGATELFDHPSVNDLAQHILDVAPGVARTKAAAGPPEEAATKEAAGEPVAEEPAAARTSDRTPASTPARPDTGEPEPVAIVGIGCRFPQADSPDGYWAMLRSGVDASTDLPEGRWDRGAFPVADDGRPGAVATRRGSFIDHFDEFDNAFFRISAREARSLDPQQRLFMEVAWEALQDAGIAAEKIRGGRTGVFVGLNTTDYQQLVTRDPENIDLYYGTGNSFSGAAGRLSYFLGVRGPSIAVDTACSSSLTAVHLACQSLASAESDIAVAGGANVMATPTVYLSMSSGALAADGRCKTFDDSADGYGRGEGAGVIVLKRLSTAVEDGDRIYAVIPGSAVNQDGASGGLTVPSGDAQREVIAAALARARISPAEVDYVEAHGTGTHLGDAIELRALDGAFGPGREPGRPLLVGSAKTNIGHLEAAAGVAGLIKVVLAMRHGEIPPHLHLATPTTQVRWDELRLTVPTERTEWARDGHARTAGISAFGFTGTNAHVIVREYAAEAAGRPAFDGPYVLPLSAATPTALRGVAERMADRLEDLGENAGGEQGDAVADVCYTAAARRTHLEHRLAVVADAPAQLVRRLRAVADGDRPRGCHVTADPSSESCRPAFAYGTTAGDLPWTYLLESAPEFAAAVGECDEIMREVLDVSPLEEMREGTSFAPATVLAQHVGLTALWRRWGVRPEAAVGHGTGELSAAWAAGALTLAQAAEALAGHEPVESREPDLPLFSASAVGRVTADGVRGRVTEPAQDARIPAGDLAEDGLDLLVEVGMGADGTGGLVLVRGPGAEAGPEEWAGRAAEAYVRGVTVDWASALGGRGRVVSLPNYPWERRRHWIDIPFTVGTTAAAPSHEEEYGHPLLGRPFTPPDQPEVAYRALILPGADDHTTSVGGVSVVSPGALAEAVAAAGSASASGVLLRDIRLSRLVPLPGDGGEPGQLRVTGDGESRTVELFAGDRQAALRVVVEPREDAPARPPAEGEGGSATVQATPAASYRLAPKLLDEAVRLLAEAAGSDGYPVAVETLWTSGRAVEGEVTVRVSVREDGMGRAWILDASGTVVAALDGVRFAPAAALTLPYEAREHLAERLYDIDWERVGPPGDGAGETGRWLVYAEERELGEHVAAALRDAGQETVTAGAFEDPDVTVASPEDWGDRLSEVARDGLRGVVHLVAGACDPDPVRPEASSSLTRTRLLRLCQALAGLGEDEAAPLRIVTSGAQDPAGDVPVAFTQAAAWELGRVFAMDSPAMSGGLLDLDPADTPEDAARHVVAALLGRAEDDQLCVRRGAWHAARLRHAAPVDPTVPAPNVRPDRWHLVTGGLEAGGAPVVDWLVDHGAKLLLLSAGPGSADGADAPEGLPEDVRVRVVDPGERFERDLEEAREEAPIGGVCVAVTPAAVRPFADTTPDAVTDDVRRAALAARADRATRDDDLDAFVLFRSAAPSWGSVGSAVNATADAWINALATERRFAGYATQLVSWMPRSDTGELGHRDRNLMEDSGLTPLTAADVREAFDYLIRAGVASAAVAVADEAAYVRICQAQAPRTFLSGLEDTAQEAASGGEGSAAPLAQELLALPEQEREDQLTEELLTVVGDVLGDDADIAPDKGFFELGMDSVMSLSLKTRVERALGCELPATLTFEFPTTAALVRHLLDEALVTGDAPADEPGEAAGSTADVSSPEPEEPDTPAESLDDDELLSRLDAAMSKSESILGD